MTISKDQAARIIHAALEYLNMFQGNEYPLWDEMSVSEREMFVEGVNWIFTTPGITPEEAHVFWQQSKEAAGWTYGPIKNYATKQHPSIRPFAQLPVDEQVKDTLFIEMVRALSPIVR